MRRVTRSDQYIGRWLRQETAAGENRVPLEK